MPRHGNRPFRGLDALVLVIATAAGAAGAVDSRSRHMATAEFMGHEAAPLWDRPSHLAPAVFTTWAVALVPLTAAVALLRLAPPRPSFQRLWRQPGFLACIAVLFAIGWRLFILVKRWAAEVAPPLMSVVSESWPYQLLEFAYDRLFALEANAGGIVAIAWIVAWLAGRWRPEPSWIDRAGCLLGAAWIAMTLMAAMSALTLA